MIDCQVKFSELTLDMFRMLQVLEREPEDAPSRTLAISTEVSDDNRVSHNFHSVQYKTKQLCWLEED